MTNENTKCKPLTIERPCWKSQKDSILSIHLVSLPKILSTILFWKEEIKPNKEMANSSKNGKIRMVQVFSINL